MLRPTDISEYIPTLSDTWKNDHERYIFSDEDISNMLDILAEYYYGPDVILSLSFDENWFQDILQYKQELQDEETILTEFEHEKAKKTQESFSDDDNYQNAYISLLLLSGLEGFRELLEKMSDISFFIHLQKTYHSEEYSTKKHRAYYAHLKEMVEKINEIVQKYGLELKEYELGNIRLVEME